MVKTKNIPQKLKKPLYFYDKNNKLKRLNIDGTVDDFIEWSKFSEIHSELGEIKWELQETKNKLNNETRDKIHASECLKGMKYLHHDTIKECKELLTEIHTAAVRIDKFGYNVQTELNLKFKNTKDEFFKVINKIPSLFSELNKSETTDLRNYFESRSKEQT